MKTIEEARANAISIHLEGVNTLAAQHARYNAYVAEAVRVGKMPPHRGRDVNHHV